MSEIVNFLSLAAALITILGAGGLPVILPQKFKDRMLIGATYDNRNLFLRYAIFSGANLNVKDSTGWTALHIAAFFGHFKIVKTLVNAGADIDSVNSENRTPLMFSISKEQWSDDKPKIVKYLLDKGADVNYGDIFTAMVYAKRDSQELVSLLKDYGAEEKGTHD